MPTEREAEARQLTDEAKRLNIEAGRNSLERGRIYRRVNNAELYKDVGFKSFSEWLESVGDDGKSWAYALIDLYDELEATVPQEAIPNLTAANARDLTKLPESKRSDPTVLAAAQEMPNNKFREVLNRFQPGIALESRQFKSFKLEDGAKGVVDECVKLAIDESEGDIKTEGAALEYICAEWKMGRQTQLEAQRRAVLLLGRLIDSIIAALIPSLTFPSSSQWKQVVLGWERVRQVFGFPQAEDKPTRSPRKPKAPPAEADSRTAVSRLQ